MKIRRAEEADLATITAMLSANGLPATDLEGKLPGFVVAEDGLDIVGVAGIERCGEYGLLRSVAVDEKWRSHGVARRLVDRLIEDARSNSLAGLYLLTETAQGYFPNFGFETISREAVPEAVRATHEFAHACPSSATVMRLLFV